MAMYKSWSIKYLLQLWSLITIIALVVIAVLALSSNNYFTAAQNNLTEIILPVENASRQISGVMAAFIARQEQVIASSSIDDLAHLTSREQLELGFNKNWQKISLLISAPTVTKPLMGDYQQFLVKDDQLLTLVSNAHEIQGAIGRLVTEIDNLNKKIESNIELISGKINLQISRAKRLSKSSNRRIDNERINTLYDIQKSSYIVGVNTLRVTGLTLKIIQANDVDSLLSIYGNEVQPYSLVLDSHISQLQHKIQADSELTIVSNDLKKDIHSLLRIMVGNNNSVYQLRQQQLMNKQSIDDVQQQAIQKLSAVMHHLDKLSISVNEQSTMAVNGASQSAKKMRKYIIIVSIAMVFGMLAISRGILGRVRSYLLKISDAMDALSSKKFDTRLEIIPGQTEYSLLAHNFNLFAENNQNLIGELAEAKDSIQAREQHISSILNGVPEAILTLSENGEVKSSNPAAEQVLKVQGNILLGLTIMRFIADKTSFSTFEDVRQASAVNQELEGIDYNNQPFYMWISFNKISNRKKHSDEWVCVISDITAWKHTEDQLKSTSSELDAILENAMVGIALIKERVIVRVNNKFEEIFSSDREFMEGKSTRLLYPSDAIYSQVGEESYSEMEMGGNYVGEAQLIKQDDSLFWGMVSCKALDATNPKSASIWLFEDITEQREKDEKLLRLASVDSLTGLPNRTVFNDRLEHAIDQSNRKSVRLAVFFIDLDRFKHINDSLGHKVGDDLLCEVAKRLKSCVRASDTVARLGGDEFTIILEDIASIQYVAKVADKILNTVSHAYTLNEIEINISPSIGISLYPADGKKLDTLVRNADAAMYHAKESGRNNFQFYSAEMNAQATERLAMQASLRRAVDKKEFHLNYQPQIDLQTGKMSGAEALLRWECPEWGTVSPMTFIPILEDMGLISEVGEQVLRQACEFYQSLKDKLEPDFQVAVNLSGRQFNGGQLASVVKHVLSDLGMSAKNLELEITENILMSDTNLAVTTLNELSASGISLAIDDFGTGYSSLSYLKQFPLDVLKIDRSFIRDVTDDTDDAAIVDAILAMSHSLNLEVVAEGVETIEQLKFLQDHGSPRVQGYYFSKPLSLEDFSEFIGNNDIKTML